MENRKIPQKSNEPGKTSIFKVWSLLEQHEATVLNDKETQKIRQLSNDVIKIYQKIVNVSNFTDSEKGQFVSFFKEIQDYVTTRTEIFG